MSTITTTPPATTRKTLLIVYHSLTGGTAQMAQAAQAGAQSVPGVSTLWLHAAQASPPQVLQADGYLFATPENLAAMSGMLKDFFDRCYYDVLDQVNGRPYAALICAGSDGQGAARQVERIATGWRLRAIAPATVVITGAQTEQAILAPKTIAPDELARCEALGAAFAAGLAAGIF